MKPNRIKPVVKQPVKSNTAESKDMHEDIVKETQMIEEDKENLMMASSEEIKKENVTNIDSVVTNTTQFTKEEKEVVVKTTTTQTKENQDDDDEYSFLINSIKNPAAVDAARRIISRFNTFNTVLRPGIPVKDMDAAARADITFWKDIQGVLNIEDYSIFRNVWGVVLAIVNKNSNGVFSDRYVDRFKSHWTISKSDAEARDAVFNLMKITAHPNTRTKGLKSIDMGRVVKLLNSIQSQNLMMFYEQH